ncbi:hypothetical protein OOT33_07670 [Sphingobium sp. DEHP117]|uniref:hypothetical protein n=1 Tax=Sphingobium sp. DEHP117 TaxID=2993436 RepID=UPI0027D5F41A|nr:hypothetical protein [Sphingobium sp. DEHP117]MDQ4420311.1 hypothetical protein [Sphingobium sp. DEHP117]
MSWSELHKKSADLAFRAAQLRVISRSDAEGLYAAAAKLEIEALDAIPFDKIRTRGIIGVSAASLLFKGKLFSEAEELALQLLNGKLLEDARVQLQAVLQAVWNEAAKRERDIKFLPGQVIVSISGGEVVTGGAPLDLILSKVQTVQNIFIRTVEYLSRLPLRTRGRPSPEIRDYCRPWLFQAPAGSYQFAVAVQGPQQRDFFKDQLAPMYVTDKFLDIVQASASGSDEQLEHIITDEDYRTTFVRLTKILSPTGRNYERVRIYSYDNPKEINLSPDARHYASEYIASIKALPSDSGTRDKIVGTLRALDLDRDWLEIEVEGRHQRIVGLQDAIDDVIGPLVNKKVTVTIDRVGRKLNFVDIDEN